MNTKKVRLIVIAIAVAVFVLLWQKQPSERLADGGDQSEPSLPENLDNIEPLVQPESLGQEQQKPEQEVPEQVQSETDVAPALSDTERLNQAREELDQSWAEWSKLLVAANTKIGKHALIASPIFASLVAQNPSELLPSSAAKDLALIESQNQQLQQSIKTLSKLYPSIATWQKAKEQYDRQLPLWNAFKRKFQVDLTPSETDKVAYLENKITQGLKTEDYGVAARSADLIRNTYQSWAEKYKQALVAQALPKMIAIAGGEFVMGDLNDQGQKDELPALTRQVAPFKISETEITFAQYDAYLIYQVLDLNEDSSWGRGARPAINVSHTEAANFATWLSEVTQRQFALPTEEQWEYAARANTSTPFAFGKSLTHNARCEGCDAWGQTQSLEVKQFEPNQFGLYDMHGNVWEWTRSCHTSSYDPAEIVPDETCEKRVARGGGWRDLPVGLRSANRNPVRPEAKSNQLGFRLIEIQ